MKGNWTVPSLIAWNLLRGDIVVWSAKTDDEKGVVLSLNNRRQWVLESVEDGMLSHIILSQDSIDRFTLSTTRMKG